MPLWDELVKLSVLGTEHQSAAVLVADGPLASAVEQIQNDEKRSVASKILCAAAATELYQRVGKTLERTTATGVGGTQVVVPGGGGETEVCPDDFLLACGERSSSHLGALITEGNEDLLKEWLEVAKRLGKRPPHFLLPLLLELGVSKTAIRSAIIDGVGERAKWLAIQNENWRYVLCSKTDYQSTDFASMWETGEIQERVSAFKSVRQNDPDRAREMLTSSWKQDPPEQRVLFLAELRTNLSLSDEPFLEETALDDRRKEIRTTTAELLASIGQSRFTRRMIERVSARLIVQKLENRNQAFELVLPEECNKGMERDGVLQTRVTAVGQRADWLVQMIGTLDPAFWCERFGVSPTGMIETILNSEEVDRKVLFTGLHDAIVRHRSVDWVAPIVNAGLGTNISSLFEFLDQPSKEGLIMWYIPQLRKLQSQFEAVDLGIIVQYLVVLMRHCPALGEPSALVLLEFCKQECANNRDYYNPISSLLPVLALKLPLSLTAQASKDWKSDGLAPSLQRVFDRFIEIISLRKEMHEALAQ